MCFCSHRLNNLYIDTEKNLLYQTLFAEQQPNGGYKYINMDKQHIKPLINNEVISCINKNIDIKTNEPKSTNSTYTNSNNNIFEVATNQIRKLHFDIDIANKHSINENDKEYLDDGELIDIANAIKKTLKDICGVVDEAKLKYIIFNKIS